MKAYYDLGLTLRDGVRLSSDVYLPDGPSPRPAVLVRTCYNKTQPRFLERARLFCQQGYAFVVNDVRGRGDSDGRWAPWVSEFEDGYDTIEWVAAQPWCNGRVGTLGGSYEGWVQWAAAAKNPPHLTTMITGGSPGYWFHDWPYRGGALYAADYIEWLNRTSGRTVQPAFLPDLAWIRDHSGLHTLDADLGRPMPDWQQCLDHPRYDEYWRRLAIDGYERMNIPVLHITGYYDACAPGELHHFQEMVRRSPASEQQALLIGAWDHSNAIQSGRAVDSCYLGLAPVASIDMQQIWLAWFDDWLMQPGEAEEAWPRVCYYAMGAGGWREAGAWPPEDTALQPWYLHGDGALSPHPDGDPTPRSYRYDPRDPVSAFPDLSSKLVSLEWTPTQTGPIEGRGDVLVYTSQPLDRTVDVAGPVQASLFASSTAADTDFVVMLCDVSPQGASVVVSQGIVRAAFRDSLTDPVPLDPHTVYRFPIELSDVAHVFRPGHCLRLLVTSSLFPWFHPNPNSGESYESETHQEAALQTVYHEVGRLSSLMFFVREECQGDNTLLMAN